MTLNKQLIGGVTIAAILATAALFGTSTSSTLFANTASANYGGGSGGTVKICHKGTNTIRVANRSVKAHLEHGDVIGACGAPVPAVLGISTHNPAPTYTNLSAFLTSPTPDSSEITVLKTKLLALMTQLVKQLQDQMATNQ